MAILPSHRLWPLSLGTSSVPEDVVEEKTAVELEKTPSASVGSSGGLSTASKLSSPSRDVATISVIVDAVTERHLLRKIDLHVYPILFIIYMLSFLDRINISNARIQGLTEDLDMHDNDFNIALFVSHQSQKTSYPQKQRH